MKFKYTGEAPEGFIDQYGVKFVPGEASEVSDTFAIGKLSNHPLFEAVGDSAPVVTEEPKKRGGRPKKEVVTDGNPDESAAQ